MTLCTINLQKARPHQSVWKVIRRSRSGSNAFAHSDESWALGTNCLSNRPPTVGRVPFLTACRLSDAGLNLLGRREPGDVHMQVELRQCSNDVDALLIVGVLLPTLSSCAATTLTLLFLLRPLVFSGVLLVHHLHEIVHDDGHVIL